jgi:hypothetical protein
MNAAMPLKDASWGTGINTAMVMLEMKEMFGVGVKGIAGPNANIN